MLIIGHRGACGYAPENTLLSFKTALKHNLPMVEFDVRVCLTGECVLFHDDDVSRFIPGDFRSIESMGFDEVRRIPMGAKQNIPTLEDVLHFLGGKIDINVELKGKGSASQTAKIIGSFISNSGGVMGQFLFSSFDLTELKTLRRFMPEARLGLIIEDWSDNVMDLCKKYQLYSIHPAASGVNKARVAALHKINVKVYAYTINTAARYNKMLNAGVDGVFTDFAGAFK